MYETTAPATMTVTRGLPGSGKTTWAREQLHADPEQVIVGRDGLRRMMFGGFTGDPQHEEIVTAVQAATIMTLLNRGVPVICDDTNLDPAHVEQLRWVARAAGSPIYLVDFTDVPVEVCIERDAQRPEGERVGEATIRRMWADHLATEA